METLILFQPINRQPTLPELTAWLEEKRLKYRITWNSLIDFFEDEPKVNQCITPCIIDITNRGVSYWTDTGIILIKGHVGPYPERGIGALKRVLQKPRRTGIK